MSRIVLERTSDNGRTINYKYPDAAATSLRRDDIRLSNADAGAQPISNSDASETEDEEDASILGHYGRPTGTRAAMSVR